MEGHNYYAAQFSSKNAKNEQEMNNIAVCNAAAIGVAKTMKKLNPGYLSKEDFEDAMSDAILNALLHIDGSTAGLSYADKCGMSSAIKACKEVTKRNSRFSRIDRIDDDGDWYQDSRLCAEESDELADSGIIRIEDAEQKSHNTAIFWKSFEEMSSSDQKIASMRAASASTSEIAGELGCSTGTASKRVFDMKSRFDRILSTNGYVR